MSRLFINKLMFYLTVLAYSGVTLLTPYGNYYHGGTVQEKVVLDVVSVVILAWARWLFFQAGRVEKGLLILLSLLPLLDVGYGLMSAVKMVLQ